MKTAFRTRDLHDWPYVGVLLIAAAGIVYSSIHPNHWLRGVGMVAVAMFVGGGLRALLTDRQAGLLAVRRRRFDVWCYLVLGTAIIGIGLLLPH